MKVLKPGEENESLWKTETTCTGKGWEQNGKTPCGALLEVKTTDIRRRNHTDMSGTTDTYYGFTCCVCGCFTELKAPYEVEHMAKKYEHKFIGA